MKILFIWVSGATAQRNRVFCHFLFLAESLLFLSRGWRRQQPMRTRSTSRSPEIPDSFCAPHQDRTKQDRRCCHVTWYFLTSSGPIPLACVASRTCLDNLSCGILRTRLPNQRNCDIAVRRRGLTFKALRISQLRTLSRSVAPQTLRKNPIYAACT